MIYVRVFAAMLAAILLKSVVRNALPPPLLHADIHGISAYLSVLGGLYSILLAFTIYVVWEQFNQVQKGLIHEAAALEDLWCVAAYISNREATGAIRQAVNRYIESTIGDEFRHLAAGHPGSLAEERFTALCQAARGTEVQTAKDRALYDELLRALGQVGDRRDERLSASVTRIPPTLWSLVFFISCSLLGGFLLLGILTLVLDLSVVAAVAGSLVFLLSVVKDIDNPFTGVWNVSYRPMSDMAARISMM